jgi:hypothetical protein
MAEEVIFQQGSVSVTKTLVRIGNKSYPVNGIVSVFVRNVGVVWWAAIVGAIAILIGISNAGGGQGSQNFIVGLVIGGGLIVYALTRPSVLVLKTAGGDVDALVTRDKAFLNDVKGAIEEAVSKRG